MNKTPTDKATPRPWRLGGRPGYVTGGTGDDSRTLAIVEVDRGSRDIDKAHEELLANAALIVRAVNTIDQVTAQRDALLGAVNDALHQLTAMREPVYGSDEYTEGAADNLRAAIALCQKGEK